MTLLEQLTTFVLSAVLFVIFICVCIVLYYIVEDSIRVLFREMRKLVKPFIGFLFASLLIWIGELLVEKMNNYEKSIILN